MQNIACLEIVFHVVGCQIQIRGILSFKTKFSVPFLVYIHKSQRCLERLVKHDKSCIYPCGFDLLIQKVGIAVTAEFAKIRRIRAKTSHARANVARRTAGVWNIAAF